MVINLDEIYEGAIVGEAILEGKKAEEKVIGDGYPILNFTYVVVDSMPQGPNEISVNGEYIFHTIFLPLDTDEPDRKMMKLKGLKRMMSAHGIDSDGAVDTTEIVEWFNSNRPTVGATLEVDDYQLKKTGEEKTRIKKFYQPA